MVKIDNCDMTGYINKQQGIRSTALLKLVNNLWCRALEHLLLLRELQVSAPESRGTDLASAPHGCGAGSGSVGAEASVSLHLKPFCF